MNYSQSPVEQKNTKFCPLAKKFCCLIPTHQNSALAALRAIFDKKVLKCFKHFASVLA